MVLHEATLVEQLLPLGEHALHLRIGVGNLAAHQLHVEVIAVEAHVDVIEPARRRPQILRADHDRLDAGRLQLVAGAEKIVPGGDRRGDAGLLQ